MELTVSCLDLSGIKFGNSVLRIRRPNDYKPEMVSPALQPLSFFNPSVLEIVNIGGGTQSQRSDTEPSPGRMFIGGLPYYLTDDQIKELLGAFGMLKNFNLVRDQGSATSKGYAFCEYLDPTCTTTAIAGLHGLPLGDKTLTVRLASAPTNNNNNNNSGGHVSVGGVGLGVGLASYGYSSQGPEYVPAAPSGNEYMQAPPPGNGW
jgi:splicing factor U2AF subunit